MGAAMSDDATALGVYQNGRRILTTGSMLVERGAAPLVLSYGSAMLVAHLDLDEPITLADGRRVGEPVNADSIAPEQTKERALGEAFARYRVTAFPVGNTGPIPPRTAGRHGQLTFLLSWEVWTPAPGMAVPGPSRDWDPPLASEPMIGAAGFERAVPRYAPGQIEPLSVA